MVVTTRHARWPLAAAAAALAVLPLTAGPASASSPATVSVQPVAGTWGTDGRVTEILPLPGGQKVIAGSFSSMIDPAGVAHPAANVALLDAAGALVPSWAGGTDGEVDALAASGNRLYLGGKFDQVDGQPHRRLAAVDLTTGALDTGFTATATGNVLSLAVTDSAVFVGGSFTSVKTPTQGEVSRLRLARLDLATGAVDPGWNLHPNNRVRSLLVSPDQTTLYVGGDFTAFGSYSRLYAAAVTTGAGSAALRSFQIGINGNVFKTAYDGGYVYLATDGYYGGICAAVDATTGATVWAYRTNGNVQAVTAIDGIGYCGGHFSTISASLYPRQHVAAVETATKTILPWSPRVNSAMGVWALAHDSSTLLMGGDFTRIGRAAFAHYAQFDGTP